MQEDPTLVDAVRVQGAKLQVLSVLADLAADPLDVQRAEAMRRALDEADDIRPLLSQMRRASRERPRLSLVHSTEQKEAQ